ncbi:hypothetical protein EZV62_001315 [Acer yangbiense]|uniref:Endonuclease/exonuclease/phosphatase domain-containing protein n=1 Tax=Acer yangbiense TaxID=1000413 RepID=A0A5C7IW34_9ROSI|nr:hypothetical protein EZV62_001315 [Acer yangbiense]
MGLGLNLDKNKWFEVAVEEWVARPESDITEITYLAMLFYRRDLRSRSVESHELPQLECQGSRQPEAVQILTPVDQVGLSGGLALLWKEGFNVQIKSFSSSHIDSIVVDSRGNCWRFNGFYSSLKYGERQHSWTLLRHLSELFNLPWLCCRDFNEISMASEKKRGNDKPYSLLSAFRDFLNLCEFRDLGFIGSPFTWWNKRDGINAIFEILDHGLGTSSWCNLFPSNSVCHLSYWGSDHRPLLIEFGSLSQTRHSNGPSRSRRFHMEEMWIKFQDCEDIISSSWKESSKASEMKDIQEKINTCALNLSRWSHQKFGGNVKDCLMLKNCLKAYEAASGQSCVAFNLALDSTIRIRDWNSALVRNSFLPDDANLILNLPQLSLNRDDTLCWHFDKRGFYSVRRGYKLAVDVQCMLLGEKVLQCISASDFSKIVVFLSSSINNDLFNLFILGCWHLWTNRNCVVHGSASWVAADMVAWVDNFANEFRMANEPSHKEILSHQSIWKPPKLGGFKINYDASFRLRSSKAIVVVII